MEDTKGVATKAYQEVRVDVDCFLVVGDEDPKPIVISIFYNPMRRKPPECWLRRIERAA